MTVHELAIKNRRPTVLTSFRFDKLGRSVFAVAQMAIDYIILAASSCASLSLVIVLQHHDPNDIQYSLYAYPTVAASGMMVFMFARSGIYNLFNLADRLAVLRSSVKRLIETMLVLIGSFYIFKVSDDFSRAWLVVWAIISALALCGLRLVMSSAVLSFIRNGRLAKNVAIVAASELGQKLAAKLVQESFGAHLVGLFDERRSRLAESLGGGMSVYRLSALDELLCKGCVDEVVIAVPPPASERILELSRRFQPFAVSLRVLAPEGYERFQVLDSHRYGEIGTFRIMGKPLDEVANIIKRLEDVVLAGFCLLFTLPLMLLVAAAIKLDSRGPVLFRQKRLGANNRPFDLLKFRSMYTDQADPLGHQLTSSGDPRITRVGRLLRRTSLDELPQLINVLRGDMSLVGPRPHPLAANAAGIAYAQAVSEYPLRHRVKPGITGWAQVKGWRGETTTIEQIRRRVEHDLYYIENWSLAFDLLILVRTVIAVLSRANAV